jgi:SSS family solute:Na+ symporter
MFWKRATGHGAFYGLLSGTIAAAVHHGLTIPAHATSLAKGGWMGAVWRTYPSEMAQNFWTAMVAWVVCFLMTIMISLLTRRTKKDDELRGLVYSLTPRIRETVAHWYLRPGLIGSLILAAAAALYVLFW